MKSILFIALLVAVSFMGCSKGEKMEANVERDKVLKWLMAGNERFVSKGMSGKDLASGQSPSAIVLACSDSRVSPEILFDEDLGEIFVVRTAGNVSNPDNVASIEYAIEHLNTKLVMVLGHDSCGAIQAAIKGVPADQSDMKNLHALTQNIRENIESVGGSIAPNPNDPKCDAQAIANVRGVIKDITAQSEIISKAVKNGKISIVPAMFSLESGKVELLSE